MQDSLIKKLNIFLQEASTFPMVYWESFFISSRHNYLKDLAIIKRILAERGNKYLLKLAAVENVWTGPEFLEENLAESFLELAKIFDLSGLQNEEIITFLDLSQKFLARVKNEQKYTNLRALSKKLSLAEQQTADLKLFQGVGSSYCLEYYLAIYKKLLEAKNEQEKLAIIESANINLGSGEVPGLRADILSQEMLYKFIYLILDDNVRISLIWSFFDLTRAILAGKELLVIEKLFKDFVFNLLQKYEKLGIKNVSSSFLKPFGEKPSVFELLKRVWQKF